MDKTAYIVMVEVIMLSFQWDDANVWNAGKKV